MVQEIIPSIQWLLLKGRMLMKSAFRCPEYIFSTDLWPTEMDYYVWVYTCIHCMQLCLSTIDICSSSRFDTVSENLSSCRFWEFPTYFFLEQNFHYPGVEITKWSLRSQRRVNMGFINIHLAQVGLVIILFTGSMQTHYHVVFDEWVPTVVSNTTSDSEVQKRLFM